MTNRFKDFGAGSPVEAEPVSFKIYDETFECVKQVQGKLLLELVADSSSSDPAKSSQIINRFFEYVLLDESYARFEKLLTDKEKIVSVETLAEITGWLVEEYTNRPEKQPEAS
jgi:hypothetical protein